MYIKYWCIWGGVEREKAGKRGNNRGNDKEWYYKGSSSKTIDYVHIYK